jgi:hypothetical protein
LQTEKRRFYDRFDLPRAWPDIPRRGCTPQRICAKGEPVNTRTAFFLVSSAVAFVACGSPTAMQSRDDGSVDTGNAPETGPSVDGLSHGDVTRADGPVTIDGGGREDASDASTDDASTDAGAGSDGCVADAGAAAWIRANFAGTNDVTGDFMSRRTIETPALVHDATNCCAKYAFDLHETTAPIDPRAGFVNVMIHDLVSTDGFGGGIVTANAPMAELFLANVTIVPNWPTWVGYSSTNYDGLVLDASNAIYAEDLTVRDWNADAGIDNKAQISQFVRLTIAGNGNRSIRYWHAGPHYLVDSSVNNGGMYGEGAIMWFADCTTAEVRIWNSTFNGSATVPASRISCNTGTAPTITYLTVDPRTTGEMHEMFGRCR